MHYKRKYRLTYTPPMAAGTQEVLLEKDLLTMSSVVPMHFDTSAQDVEDLDYVNGDAYFEDYNYKWE